MHDGGVLTSFQPASNSSFYSHRFFWKGSCLGNHSAVLLQELWHQYLRWPDSSTSHQRGSEPSQDRWISSRPHQATPGILEWHSRYALINLSICKYSAWIAAQRETGFKSCAAKFLKCLKIPKSPLKYHLSALYGGKARPPPKNGCKVSE